MLTESGSRVIGPYPDPRALQADLDASSTEAQVALIDAEDPASGIAALAEVRRACPKLKIVLLCDGLTPAIVRCAIVERVEGVVLKSDSPEEVILALHHVLEGRAVMPSGWQTVPIDPEGGAPIESLSAREREVLELRGRRHAQQGDRRTAHDLLEYRQVPPADYLLPFGCHQPGTGHVCLKSRAG